MRRGAAGALAAALVAIAFGCGRKASESAAPPEAAASGPADPGAAAPAAAADVATADGTTPEGAAAVAAGAESGVPAVPDEPNRREVVLFFERADDDTLGPETRQILLSDSIIDQAKQIVAELAAGPRQEELLPTVPEETRVLGLYLDRAGTAYVDLSSEFVDRHPGGSSEEVATVFSIVDSLTYNLPEVKRVRFLINGEERETLKSHLDLRRAYLKDMSIVRMEGG